MKSNISLIVVGALFLATVAAMAWLMVPFGFGISVWDLFIESSVIVKMCLMLVITGGVAGVIGGLARVKPLVWIGVGVAILFGALGGIYGEAMSQAAVSRMGGSVSFEVLAPGRIESLFSVATGLLAALLILVVFRLSAKAAAIEEAGSRPA